MSSQVIYTLPSVNTNGDAEADSLRTQIERGLAGTDTSRVPGDTEEDKKWAYKRSVPTVVLYDEAGLRLYDKITADAPEYYLFADELNLFQNHGHEIALAMGFPGGASSGTNECTAQEGETCPKQRDHFRYPPPKPWKPARWGDAAVGKWNNGVNGEEGLGGGAERGWDVVELGAGALRKTAHLLTALAEALPPSDNDEPQITYHALDLSRPELERVLGEMDDAYGDALAGRVACYGLHGDYFAGLKFVRDGGLASLSASGCVSPQPTPSDTVGTTDESDSAPASPMSPVSHYLATPAMDAAMLPAIEDADVEAHNLPPTGMSPPETKSPIATVNTVEASSTTPGSTDESDDEKPEIPDRPLHMVFLGSSLGNFDRAEAAPFLRALPLRTGDTLLLGLDGRPAPGAEGTRKVQIAYNDPQGHTRAFEEHGWDVAREALGLQPDDNIEFVGRYNEVLGRHEAYYRAKDAQTIHLPDRNEDVNLEAGELLHIEWSYKYSLGEALQLFVDAGLNVIDSWKAPGSEYRLWLLERPEARPVVAEPNTNPVSWPANVPTWAEWEGMWKVWDHITLNMISKSMLHQKPIDLRHICLFYLGHIPTFLDIFLTRATDGKHTHPEFFKDIFERGIDPDVDDPNKIHSHSIVPTCEADWPTLESIVAFRDRVRERLRKVYDDMEGGRLSIDKVGRSVFMGLEHEAMHAETLLYMLLQSPLTRAPGPTPQWDTLAAHWAAASDAANKQGTAGILTVPAMTVSLGHNDLEAVPTAAGGEYGWDNEHPGHAVPVGAFAAEALPVTNAQYLAFLSESGKLAALTAGTAPASWVQAKDGWAVRTLFGPVPMAIAGAWPLMASRDELLSYAFAHGGRLPTEPELRALWTHPQGPRPAGLAANVGFKHWHPVPPAPTIVDNAGKTLHGHNGGVWEWTSTPFAAYDGFVESTLYPGYSADFFDGKHFVVLGGSFATVPQIARRKSFRNWYQSNYRFAWCGGRVVYDV